MARERHEFDLWAYVVMPEHVHMLIWPKRETYAVSAVLQAVKQSVSRRALNWLRKNRPEGLSALATGQKSPPHRFWLDGGCYDRNVRSAVALAEMIDYIHDNPVKRGLVGRAKDWPWSSARAWLLDEDGWIPVDKESCNASLV
jgi:putative transposase